ncbi:MAG: class I SAM-dependent methyltransferase [Chlamydiales bacterium]
MSYYKFGAKMIGPNKRVLDIGCNEGFGSYLLAKECGYCLGLDFDSDAIKSAQQNFFGEHVAFVEDDFLEREFTEKWDAITSFDVIEHITPEHVPLFLGKIANCLSDNGTFVIGTPSEISQQFASPIARRGHVNIYSPERLEEELREYFEYVFMFAGNDEVVHTGYLPLAHYLLALACKPRCWS